MRQCAAIDLRVSTLTYIYASGNNNIFIVQQCTGRSLRQCEQQCVAVRVAVCDYRQCVWQSVSGSEAVRGSAAVCGSVAMCGGSAAVCGSTCGSVHGSVWYCAVVRQCSSVEVCDSAAVCDSASGSVWQYARCNVQQCGNM
jgi:arginine exporter protein ArgO